MFSVTNTHRPNKKRREQAATPTPSVNNIESVAVDEENCVQLGYHYKGTEDQIQGEQEKNTWYEGIMLRLLGGGQGDDENASRKSTGTRNSRKDDMSVTSALSNASNKSARSNKSFVSAVAIEPNSETVHEDVENIPLNDCDAMLVDGGQGDDDNASHKSSHSRNSRSVMSALSLAVFGGGHGDDENASRKSTGSRNNSRKDGKSENASHKDDMSVTSALSNASNKSAQSNKSFVSAVATEPTLEVVHEDVEDPLRVEVRRHYKQKSKDVAAGLSRKKMKVIVGLSGLVVGAVLGVIIGVALESREATEERANVEVAAAAYLDNYDETHGQLDYSYYYDYYYDSEIPDTGVAEAATLTSEEVNVTISSEPL
ncbi:hypothetical protein THAOC_23360 [Thalassiosira oceanica]|uniref:Uncharacterized protein n=1 Tax=Thalassiosira oceanica TaxID=159749 RepID=K0RSF5_THAOC|nr:hypothetical protein THAOC_23360 [Thalassiosira oceanica]|eukprot:EJK56703.1 hypothetical protein THAOC_23360 [Thalassiosira oceanica]